jgi:hypothetical protein
MMFPLAPRLAHRLGCTPSLGGVIRWRSERRLSGWEDRDFGRHPPPMTPVPRGRYFLYTFGHREAI